MTARTCVRCRVAQRAGQTKFVKSMSSENTPLATHSKRTRRSNHLRTHVAHRAAPPHVCALTCSTCRHSAARRSLWPAGFRAVCVCFCVITRHTWITHMDIVMWIRCRRTYHQTHQMLFSECVIKPNQCWLLSGRTLSSKADSDRIINEPGGISDCPPAESQLRNRHQSQLYINETRLLHST